jgi:hypothetical protein
MLTSRQKNAYHESGHAVSAAVLNGRCKGASIIPSADGKSGGVAYICSPDNVTKSCAVILAGAVAAWQAKGRAAQMFDASTAADLSQLDTFICSLYGGRQVRREDTSEYSEGMTLAKNTVGIYWPAIERVARWLLDRNTISGKLVHQFVNEFDRQKARQQT